MGHCDGSGPSTDRVKHVRQYKLRGHFKPEPCIDSRRASVQGNLSLESWARPPTDTPSLPTHRFPIHGCCEQLVQNSLQSSN